MYDCLQYTVVLFFLSDTHTQSALHTCTHTPGYIVAGDLWVVYIVVTVYTCTTLESTNTALSTFLRVMQQSIDQGVFLGLGRLID